MDFGSRKINTASRPLVALRSSPRDNWWRFYNQKGSKTPENQGFPGFSCIYGFDSVWLIFAGFDQF